jgi:hypothetical protein
MLIATPRPLGGAGPASSLQVIRNQWYLMHKLAFEPSTQNPGLVMVMDIGKIGIMESMKMFPPKVKNKLDNLVYVARFSTGLCTRGCQWFSRLLASSDHELCHTLLNGLWALDDASGSHTYSLQFLKRTSVRSNGMPPLGSSPFSPVPP